MNTIFKKEKTWIIASRTAMIIVLMALIRCIAECFRLNYYNETPPGFSDLKPFLLGSLSCSVALLGMVILHFFRANKTVSLTGILCVGILVYLKSTYM